MSASSTNMDPTCLRDSESATQFCTCRNQVTLLCDKCLIAHLTEAPSELHDFNPIAYFDAFKSLGLDQFQVQKARLACGSAAMHALITTEQTQYEETLRKLEESFTICREAIETFHTSFLQLAEKFEQEKLGLLSAVNPPLSKFSNVILGIDKVSSVPNKLFTDIQVIDDFHNRMKRLQSDLETLGGQDHFETYFTKVIKGETAKLPEGKKSEPGVGESIGNLAELAVPIGENFNPYILLIRGNQLAKYIISSEKVEEVELSCTLGFSMCTVSIVLPNGNIFSCGGQRNNRQAYYINATSGHVTELPKMRAGRAGPGIIYVDGKVYAFGGMDLAQRQHLSSVEKFGFQKREWTLLSSEMCGPRVQFTPCLYEQKVYIAGGMPTQQVEVFDLATERFTALQLTLPKAVPGLCFIYNEELVIAQKQKVYRWPLNSQEELKKQKVLIPAKDSNAGVQIVGEKAYYSYENDERWMVHVLDLNTWESNHLVGAQCSSGENCKVA